MMAEIPQLHTSREPTPRESALWVAMTLTKGISRKALSSLIRSHNFCAPAIWEELQALAAASPSKGRAQIRLPDLGKVEDLIADWQRSSARLLTLDAQDYPPQLLDLEELAPVLYLRGQGSLEANNALAIVGSRSATSYGLSLANDLAYQLAQLGLVIVSGLARGVDTWAHRGSLEAGGETWAVLGCGIDLCYPPENFKLRAAIEERGLLISEYPALVEPAPFRFPYRNRLIAALARGTLVVQASHKSGAMITADWVANLGRSVMAVPGAVDSLQSQGPLELISQGAALVRHSQDVLDALGVFVEELPPTSSWSLGEEEERLLKILGSQGKSTEELAQLSQAPLGWVIATLNKLELAGLARRWPDLTWSLRGGTKPG